MCEAGVVRIKQLLPIAWREYCMSSSINANQLQDEAFLEKLRARVILAERHLLAVLRFPLFDAKLDFPVPMVWKMADLYKLECVATEQGEAPVPAGLGIGKVAVNIVLDLYVVVWAGGCYIVWAVFSCVFCIIMYHAKHAMYCHAQCVVISTTLFPQFYSPTVHSSPYPPPPHTQPHSHNPRLHTSVPITRPPEVLAAAALWLARDMLCPPGALEPLYEHLLWFEHAGVSMEDIECTMGWCTYLCVVGY